MNESKNSLNQGGGHAGRADVEKPDFPAAAIVRELPETKYFSVSLESGRVVLTPMHIRPADAVRRKLEALGITESDVEDAVRWARKTSC